MSWTITVVKTFETRSESTVTRIPDNRPAHEVVVKTNRPHFYLPGTTMGRDNGTVSGKADVIERGNPLKCEPPDNPTPRPRKYQKSSTSTHIANGEVSSMDSVVTEGGWVDENTVVTVIPPGAGGIWTFKSLWKSINTLSEAFTLVSMDRVFKRETLYI